MGNVVSAVDTRLIQNDHRNIQQEELLLQLCASLTNLNGKLEKNIEDTKQINNNYIAMGKRMTEKDKNLDVELVKNIDSLAKQCEERLGACFRGQAIVSSGSNVVVESEGNPRVHPRLNYGDVVELSI